MSRVVLKVGQPEVVVAQGHGSRQKLLGRAQVIIVAEQRHLVTKALGECNVDRLQPLGNLERRR